MEGLRLLVVDDSSEFSFLLSSLFKFHKIQVDSEGNPEEALKRAEETKYNVIITDYMMDPMSGLELAEQIRRGNLNKDTKGILITAKKLDPEELRKVSDLDLLYVMKPIMPNDLYKKITEILGK